MRITGKARNAMARQRFVLSAGREITIKKLRSSIVKRSPKAVGTPIDPLAKGRFLVRATCLSIRLSHRSFAMQPAPLTDKPPAIIIEISPTEGGALGAIQSDQPAGINRISRPLGLFQRSNRSNCPKYLKMKLLLTMISIAKKT